MLGAATGRTLSSDMCLPQFSNGRHDSWRATTSKIHVHVYRFSVVIVRPCAKLRQLLRRASAFASFVASAFASFVASAMPAEAPCALHVVACLHHQDSQWQTNNAHAMLRADIVASAMSAEAPSTSRCMSSSSGFPCNGRQIMLS